MSKRFDRLLEKATDPTLLEPDWLAIMDCVDLIRSGETKPNSGLRAIMKRATHENPHVAHHALLVLESAVKNCGDKMHKEVATRECMEELKRLALETRSEKVKEKVLESIQCWSHAFRNQPAYRIINDTFNLMKMEGYDFKPQREADAIYMGQSAPEWVDSNHCYRCRAEFGLVTRKHHCRACGQIFCAKCSSRWAILPHIGIEEEVRVCERCFEKPESKKNASAQAREMNKASDIDVPVVINSIGGAPGTTSSASADPKLRPEEAAAHKAKIDALREQEELQLALAISQSEAEEKERQRMKTLYNMYNGTDASTQPSAAPAATSAVLGDKSMQSSAVADEDPIAALDPELARYLNRDFWEQKQRERSSKTGTNKRQNHKSPSRKSPTPSAPPAAPAEPATQDLNDSKEADAVTQLAVAATNGYAKEHNDLQQTGDDPDDTDDTDSFAAQLKSQIETFVNRIRSDQARGRSIVNDSSIQTLFVTLTGLHTQLLQRMSDLDEKRLRYESMQDKIAAIGEAREAVIALRDENARARAQRAWEEQQQRQMNMMHKLDVMRQKKHEMLEVQRQDALRRFQEQQNELYRQKMEKHTQQTTVPSTSLVYGTAMAQPQQQQQMIYANQPRLQQPAAAYNMQAMPQPLHHQQQQQQMMYQMQQQQQPPAAYMPNSPGVQSQQYYSGPPPAMQQQYAAPQQQHVVHQPQYQPAAQIRGVVQQPPTQQYQPAPQVQYAPQPPPAHVQSQPIAHHPGAATVEPAVGELISFD